MVLEGHSDPSMLVHWASLNLFYCSIVLSLHKAPALSVLTAETDRQIRQSTSISIALRGQLIESCILQILRTMQLASFYQQLIFLHHIDRTTFSSLMTATNIVAESCKTQPESSYWKQKKGLALLEICKRLINAYKEQVLHGPPTLPSPGNHLRVAHHPDAIRTTRPIAIKVPIRIVNSRLAASDAESPASALDTNPPTPLGDTAQQWSEISEDILNMESIIFAPKEIARAPTCDDGQAYNHKGETPIGTHGAPKSHFL
jgi:hypothetical protein